MDDVIAVFARGAAMILARFCAHSVEAAPKKGGHNNHKNDAYDHLARHSAYSGTLVVSASACNAPLLPSILPLRAA